MIHRRQTKRALRALGYLGLDRRSDGGLSIRVRRQRRGASATSGFRAMLELLFGTVEKSQCALI